MLKSPESSLEICGFQRLVSQRRQFLHFVQKQGLVGKKFRSRFLRDWCCELPMLVLSVSTPDEHLNGSDPLA